MADLLRIPAQRAGNIQNTGQTVQTQPPAGWDPYEIWRTRVLMPRLQGDDADTSVNSTNNKDKATTKGKVDDKDDPLLQSA